MEDRYRGELSKHYLIFHSIVNILQIEINCGNKLFQVKYNDKHNQVIIIQQTKKLGFS